MNIEEKKKIDELLKDRKDLMSAYLYMRSYEEVKKILEMLEWKDKKFRCLLSSNIWQSTAKEVKEILGLPQWEDEKFRELLTPSIWLRSSKEVKEILEMPEWNDEKYIGLLKPSIWLSNTENVKTKVHLKFWKEYRYQHLLAPTIFAIPLRNIEEGIGLLEKYGISELVTFGCIRKSPEQLRALIGYMNARKIDMVVKDVNTKVPKLHPILNAPPAEVKKKYNIDLKVLCRENIMKNLDCDER